MSAVSVNRRGFLRGATTVGIATAGLAVAGIPTAGAQGQRRQEEGTVVVVTLAGGLDGLSVLVPHGDPAYSRRRPTIGVASPRDPNGAIDLGGGFGLHPALAPLHNTAGREDHFAIIGGVGIPEHESGTRTHVASRRFLDCGGRGAELGWIARLLRFEGLGPEAVWSFGPGPHPMLAGLDGSVSGPHPGVSVGDHRDSSRARSALSVAFGGSSVLDRAGVAALTASSNWSGIEWTSAADRAALGYPDGHLARSLAVTAAMIKAERGLRFVAVDHPGYDTHVDQGDGRGGHLAYRLDRLARSLSAFWSDLGEEREGVVVVVVSEFGRTIDENAAAGTEHGRGGVAMVVGEDVVGGVHGDLPDLTTDADTWPASIDVRRVLADVSWNRGFRPWQGGIFPGLPQTNRSLGLLLSA